MKKKFITISLLVLSMSMTVTGCNNKSGSYHRVEELTNVLRDAQLSMGFDSLQTTGDVSILVVPVQLKNEREWTESMLDELDKCFFGSAEDTNYWESVTSYYYKSSYGQLNIIGEISDVFELNYTKDEFNRLGYYDYNEFMWMDGVDGYVIPQFRTWADPELLQKYDTDNNGHVDATIFIYSNDYTNGASDEFWAWCYYLNSKNTDLERPYVGSYMWASYSFMQDGTDDGIDAHTYIHEFGHLLGLDDYYGSDNSPVGALEMQSYNVGDQSSFSKLQLDWLKPYVLDGNSDVYDIPLRSCALYPDAILINDNWNGGSEDEYLLIEYYTPEGNNYLDSEVSYMNNSVYHMYTESGLRIYHVDARLAKLHPTSGRFISYSDQVYDDGYIYFPGATNGAGWSYLNYPDSENFKLVQLMQADVSSVRSPDLFLNGGYASNSTLYHVGQGFSASNLFFTNGDCFNNGQKVGYSISFLSEEDGIATVRIRKI